MSAIDTAALTISEPAPGGKGARMCNVAAQGKPAMWQPGSFMDIAFEAVGFNDPEAARVNLNLRPTPAVEAELRKFDDWCVHEVAKNSQALLGKELPLERVAAMYVSALKSSDKHPNPIFRAKVTLSGRGATRLWDEHCNPRKAPDTWTACAARPRIRIKAIWVTAKEFGPLFECTDVQLTEQLSECPFMEE